MLRQLWFLQQLPLGSGTSGVKANPLALPPVPACGTSLSRCQAVVCSREQIETVTQCLVVKKKQKKRYFLFKNSKIQFSSVPRILGNSALLW